ncbi:MAG: DUF3108 domain-containing protein [Bacteroidales bacterium]|nr:DUF3108 domain-containing protein [Bacteroidales bacterium]
MKRFRITLLSLLFAAVLFPSAANGQELPFAGGENLSYKMRYKWGVINADVAKLDFNIKEETYNGVPCFRLVTRGATSNLAASLVKVSYSYDSRFRTDNLVPVAFSRHQTEGSYWAKNQYDWNSAGTRLHAVVTKSTRPKRDSLFTAKSVIHDIISTIYVIRAADLDAVKKGKGLHYLAALDCNIYDINVAYVASEEKKVPDVGMVDTDKYAMYIHMRSGGERLDKEYSFSISTQEDGGVTPIYLWITPDESHVIVSFSTAIAVGRVEGRLVSASGLKAPLKKAGR